MTTVHYFAYGSNMDIDELMRYEVRIDPTKRECARLLGYVLKFNKIATGDKAKSGEGKGNIEPDPDEMVEGVLWEVRSEDLHKLDKKEGALIGHYRRAAVRVRLSDGTDVSAITYVADPPMTKTGLKPTRPYLDHYLKGKDCFSDEYYDRVLVVVASETLGDVLIPEGKEVRREWMQGLRDCDRARSTLASSWVYLERVEKAQEKLPHLFLVRARRLEYSLPPEPQYR